MQFKHISGSLFLFILLMTAACSSGHLAHFKQFYSTRLNAAYRIIRTPSKIEGKVKIQFIAEVKYKDLLFVQDDSLYHAKIRATFSIKGKNKDAPAKLIDRQLEIEVPVFAETIQSDKYVRFIESMNVDPDDFTARTLLTDANAKNLGIFSKTFHPDDLQKSLMISDPLFVKDSLSLPDTKTIFPLSEKVFTRKMFAFFEIKGNDASEEVHIRYDVRNHKREVFFKNEFTTSCDQTVCAYWVPILPEQIAVGSSSLHIIVTQGEKRDSSMANLYAQYNFSSEKQQNISYLIEPMRLIMKKDDWKALENAEGDEQEKLFKSFWEDRNPETDSDKNFLLDEFFNRVEETQQRFRYGSRDGWRTDRGRIYLINGPPDVIRHQYSQNRQSVYEIWEYRELGVTYYFRDDYGNGDYRLLSGIR